MGLNSNENKICLLVILTHCNQSYFRIPFYFPSETNVGMTITMKLDVVDLSMPTPTFSTMTNPMLAVVVDMGEADGIYTRTYTDVFSS